MIVTPKGFERAGPNVDPTTLGKLKNEATITKLEILGSKHYSQDGKVRLKGIRREATQIGPHSYQQKHWESLKGAIRAGNTNRVVLKPVVKTLALTYLKGQVSSSGAVSPIALDEA